MNQTDSPLPSGALTLRDREYAALARREAQVLIPDDTWRGSAEVLSVLAPRAGISMCAGINPRFQEHTGTI